MAGNDVKIASATASSSGDHEAEANTIDPALARRVVRKIDWWIIPLLFVTYNFNFMDKTILSSAAVFGLKESTHLEGSDYSWVSSVRWGNRHAFSTQTLTTKALRSFTSATCFGNIQHLYSSNDYLLANM